MDILGNFLVKNCVENLTKKSRKNLNNNNLNSEINFAFVINFVEGLQTKEKYFSGENFNSLILHLLILSH